MPELLGNMTQAEFARRINVSESMVSKYISGTKKMSVIKLKMAANILGCYMDDIYEWDDILRVKGKR